MSALRVVALAFVFAGCSGAVPGDVPSCRTPGLIEDEIAILDESAGSRQAIGGARAIQEMTEYPVHLRRSGVQGQATVAYVVDARGVLVCADAIEGSHPDLREAARRAIVASRFRPLIEDGEAVPFGSRATLRYRLR